MIAALIMMVCTQLPMDGIIADANKPPIPAIKMVIKEVPVEKRVEVIKRIYVYTDKFGVEHEGQNKAAVYNEVYLENQKPFQLKDLEGRLWEHQDKAVLDKFIQNRNYTIEVNKHPSFQTILRYDPQAYNMKVAPQLNFSVGTSTLNCGPVG